MVHKHIFLIAHSYPAFLGFPVAISCQHQCLMFIAVNFFSRSIILWKVIYIIGQVKTLWGCPRGPIMAINACINAQICNWPSICLSIKPVLYLVNVWVPGWIFWHFGSTYRCWRKSFWILKDSWFCRFNWLRFCFCDIHRFFLFHLRWFCRLRWLWLLHLLMNLNSISLNASLLLMFNHLILSFLSINTLSIFWSCGFII